MKKMVIPDAAVKYILFQRTVYLRSTKNILYRFLDKVDQKVLRSSIYTITVNIESYVHRETIKELYARDMHKEYLLMKDYLPEFCDTVLDVGCGVAGIDVFIFQHYRNSKMRVYLLDKTRTEKSVYYDFHQKGAFYNSLFVSKELLNQNGVPNDNIILINASNGAEVNIDEKLELVISLLSWGFHYPVSKYLDVVYSLLSDNGKLILDVRKDTDGLTLLEKKFSSYVVIAEQEKHFRVMCSKKLT